MLELGSLVVSPENQPYPQSSEWQSNSDLRVPSYNSEHKKRRLQHPKTVKDGWNVKKGKEI